MVVGADLLEPVDVRDCLGGLELTLGQVCQVAGISKMQLDYWTQKAAIPTHGRKQRTYDLHAVETVLLIKQAKHRGLSLSAAIAAVREFQAREVAAGRDQPRPRPARRIPAHPGRG